MDHSVLILIRYCILCSCEDKHIEATGDDDLGKPFLARKTHPALRQFFGKMIRYGHHYLEGRQVYNAGDSIVLHQLVQYLSFRMKNKGVVASSLKKGHELDNCLCSYPEGGNTYQRLYRALYLRLHHS